MQIEGYGHMYTALADVSGSAESVSKSSSSFGTVTVTRTRAGSGHVPYMILDWYPKFKAEAKVIDANASCMVAGLMKGECFELDAQVCAAGGAIADGKSRDEDVKVKLAGVEVGISSQSGDDNTAAPGDARHRIHSIDHATAAFCCNCTVKAAVPGSFLSFDWTQECEAWIWDCFPELDLHGCCGQCAAFGYGTYGWTQ